MATSNARKATLRSRILLVRRLGELTVVAYVKLLRTVIAERLWAIPARVPTLAAAIDPVGPAKEILS
jgi:hypothetical protein